MSTPENMTEVLHADVARFPRARLTVVKGPDKGTEVVLEGQMVVIGSDEGCQLRLNDTSVSRRHVELSGGPGGYRLRDLRSTNGVVASGPHAPAGRSMYAAVSKRVHSLKRRHVRSRFSRLSRSAKRR